MKKPLPPSRTAPQFVVRFPDDDMRDRIKSAADAGGRSMNAEIVSRLQESLDAKELYGPDGKRILSAIQRLEELLSMKDAQLASSSQSMLVLANVLAMTYPLIAPMMERSPELHERINPSLVASMNVIKKFLENYEPVGLDVMAKTTATAKRLFPDQIVEEISAQDLGEASDKLKSFEKQVVENIREVVEQFSATEIQKK